MTLMIGALGMTDIMKEYLDILGNTVLNYTTRVNLSESATNKEAVGLAEALDGDWLASSGVSLEGKTMVLEVYSANNGLVRFVDGENRMLPLTDDGVYLCQRLKDVAEIGETITISPYGVEEKYEVKVAGYHRSMVTENVVMSARYAAEIGLPCRVSAIFTDRSADDVEASPIIAGKQDKSGMMATYDSFRDILYGMVLVLVVAAAVLGVVVLYNLGVMSYLERSRELATLKVLGFRDRQIGRLLISQNIWLTVIGVLIGLPAGMWVLWYLCTALISEYEFAIRISARTCIVSMLLTFGVSLLVGRMVARKNRRIDMVEALKGAE